MAKVVHRKRTSLAYRYIGRPSIFGNPYAMQGESDRAKVIEMFEEYFKARIRSDPEFRAAVESLRGENLGCYCAPKACHGDVILAYLEETDV